MDELSEDELRKYVPEFLAEFKALILLEGLYVVESSNQQSGAFGVRSDR